PCKEYTSELWEFWSFLWSGAKELCASAWGCFKTRASAKYSELKEKAPGMWQSLKAHAIGCWEWVESAGRFTFTKAKEYSLCLKGKVIDTYNKVFTPERKHEIQEMYKTVSVKAYELFNLAKDAIVKAATFVCTKVAALFTWDNFNNGMASISAAFACPWACGVAR
ncbi:hypothetical protein FOZ63_019687, partial [Perkinsus olseni]